MAFCIPEATRKEGEGGHGWGTGGARVGHGWGTGVVGGTLRGGQSWARAGPMAEPTRNEEEARTPIASVLGVVIVGSGTFVGLVLEIDRRVEHQRDDDQDGRILD